MYILSTDLLVVMRYLHGTSRRTYKLTSKSGSGVDPIRVSNQRSQSENPINYQDQAGRSSNQG